MADKLNKQDNYIEVFMGTSYDFGKPETVGQLKEVLEKIAADLPDNPGLEIAEVHLHDGKLDYTLAEGINQ